jgi:hypothetical protein
MQTYLSILEELKEETEKTRNRSWKWLLFWQRDRTHDAKDSTNDPEQEVLIEQNGLNQPNTPSKDAPELVMERRGSVWNPPAQETNVQQGFYRKMLDVVRVLERDDGQFFSFFPPLA